MLEFLKILFLCPQPVGVSILSELIGLFFSCLAKFTDCVFVFPVWFKMVTFQSSRTVKKNLFGYCVLRRDQG